MSNSRPLTSAEQRKWDIFVAHARVLGKEIEIAQRTQKQCDICQRFADQNNISIPSVSDVALVLSSSERHLKKVHRIINGVETEQIGLSFPGGNDFDIVADPTMNEDELAYYQMSGIVLLIAGATIIAGAIAYALWERGRVKKVIDRYEATKSVANAKFCEDPNSDVCSRWISFRESQGFNDEQTFVDDLYDQIVQLQKEIPSALSTGVSWGIPIIAAIAVIYLIGARR